MASQIVLGYEGTVIASCETKDYEALRATHPEIPERAELERQVADAVAAAWEAFRSGDLKQAVRGLCGVTDAEIFLVAPENTKPMKVMRWCMGASFALALVFGIQGLVLRSPSPKPVSVTESEVRTRLAAMAAGKGEFRDLEAYLSRNDLLPGTNLFPALAMVELRQKLLRSRGIKAPGRASLREITGRYTSEMDTLMVEGWIGWEDLGVTREETLAALRKMPQEGLGLVLATNLYLHHDKRFYAERIDLEGLKRLRWLQLVHGLDTVEQGALAKKLRSAQFPFAELEPPALPEWDALHGLFFLPYKPVLEATHCHLEALEILGGLGGVHREACITAILHLHQGRGRFEDVDIVHGLDLRGDATDTFHAFESLRILGALDRVKDLERWQFRPARASKAGPTGVREATWEEIEAWVCQERLARILRERRENPKARVRSLREP